MFGGPEEVIPLKPNRQTHELLHPLFGRVEPSEEKGLNNDVPCRGDATAKMCEPITLAPTAHKNEGAQHETNHDSHTPRRKRLLTLRELRATTSAVQTVLFALFHT